MARIVPWLAEKTRSFSHWQARQQLATFADTIQMYILAHSQERKSCTDRIHSHLMLHFPRSLCSSYYVTDDSHLARGTKRQTGSTLRPLLTLVQLAPPLDVSSVIPRIRGYCLSVACLWPQIRIKSLELSHIHNDECFCVR